MTTRNDAKTAEADSLYARYGRPLERDHWGVYVAISTAGECILSESLLDVLERSSDAFAGDAYIFKVGDVSVGKIR